MTATIHPIRLRLAPVTRGDCKDGPRPCMHTWCRMHIAPPHTGGRGYHGTPTESCALDVADRGEHSMEEVGVVLGVSKQRIEQLENAALKKMAAIARRTLR